MKIAILIVLGYLSITLLVGCRNDAVSPVPSADHVPDTAPAAVMIDGRLYYFTGEEALENASEDKATGTITSVIDNSSLPEEDGQANFPQMGAPYIREEDYAIVYLDETWYYFELHEEQ